MSQQILAYLGLQDRGGKWAVNVIGRNLGDEVLSGPGIDLGGAFFTNLSGKQRYLWRAVDQDGEVVDVFLQQRRDAQAAKRFFGRLLKKHKGEPREIVTDKLRSYVVAHRELIPKAIHNMGKYANNRAELSHQPARARERGMRRFKSMKQAQRFLNAHAAVYNLFNPGRHLVSAETNRYFRSRWFRSGLVELFDF